MENFDFRKLVQGDMVVFTMDEDFWGGVYHHTTPAGKFVFNFAGTIKNGSFEVTCQDKKVSLNNITGMRYMLPAEKDLLKEAFGQYSFDKKRDERLRSNFFDAELVCKGDYLVFENSDGSWIGIFDEMTEKGWACFDKCFRFNPSNGNVGHMRANYVFFYRDVQKCRRMTAEEVAAFDKMIGNDFEGRLMQPFPVRVNYTVILLYENHQNGSFCCSTTLVSALAPARPTLDFCLKHFGLKPEEITVKQFIVTEASPSAVPTFSE